MSDSPNTIANPTSERVFHALKEARAQLEAMEQVKNERVAIIGMAGRFPGADNLDEFWTLLAQGKSGIQMLTEDELLAAGVPESRFKQPHYVPAYASFPDPTQFDARFFGYSPREAELIDPQHRVFLECAWAALEDAGYDSQQYDGTIGVYGGAALNSYVVNLHSNPSVRDGTDPVQAVISNVMGLMPTRVSYQLDLTGPSCGIQTGCSTALVAVHMAVQSLLHHECDLALAGGVTVSNATPQGYTYQADSIAAPDGVCRAFDANAQGTLFGNGVGLVVLKRLQVAIAEGDHIYAVIKGSAVNNDGADKVGLTAPSVSGQAAVIQAALDQAGVDPASISYVEGHGTGTPLGDPIEVAALNKVFKSVSAKGCALGSVKSNVGHLDAAAGAAGLIKTVLALQHRRLPPSLNFVTPNPRIEFEQGPFFVNRLCTDWVNDADTPRRAGVSSFGMGGTNAHVILEEAPPRPPTVDSRPWQLLLLSAKTPTGLEQMTLNLSRHLRDHPEQPLADIAYTLQIGRRAWPHRRVCLCQTAAVGERLLQDSDSPLRLTGATQREDHTMVFMFSGQGSQHANMALELYETEPVFRQTIDQCEHIIGAQFPLLAALYPQRDRGEGGEHTDALTQTANAQPTLFAIEYALAQLYLSWGIQPQAMIGHSIGEYVAACVAQVFSLEDALRVVVQRGQLMQNCVPGSMLSVLQSTEELRSQLPAGAEIAVVNSPHSCVVSGPTEVIEALRSQLTTQLIPCRWLDASHAFHSALMEPAMAEFGQVLQQIDFQPPQIDLISNVTGTWLTDAEATSPDYWLRHLRHTVHFSQGVTTLLQLKDPVFLELGPGHTLTKFVQQHLSSEQDIPVMQSLPHPRDQQSDAATLMTALGQLWLAGVPIDWAAFHHPAQRQRLPLPTYPFERESYWIALEEDRAPRSPTPAADETTKAPDLADWFYLPTWRRSPITPSDPPLDHCWLMFVDTSEPAAFWQPAIDRVKQIIWVTPGSIFSDTEETYRIRPHQVGDYHRLFQVLPVVPTQIIYAWGLSSGAASAVDPFQPLLYLTQALAETSRGHALTLSVVTCGVQDVTGGEGLNPNQAKILGLCQVIPQEYPAFHCRHIDIVAPASDPGVTRTSQGIAQELGTAYTPEQRLVAYRNGHRWVQTYEPLPLPEGQAKRLQPNHTYLIAGDLVEGLGMVYAQALVHDLNAKLILIGRPGLPGADDWEKWLITHSPQHGVSRLIRQLQALGTEGETFLWFSGNLADADWMQRTLRQGINQLGPITGVFHTDVMGDQASCAIAALDEDSCDRIYRSKIQGLQVLQQTLADYPPVSFYLLQSSLSAIVGGGGFGAYAAANCYLDAIAHQQHQTPLSPTQWLSLNWDACQLDEPAETQTSILMATAITAAEVWQTTQRALAQADCPQLAVSPRRLQSRLMAAYTPTVAEQQSPPGQLQTAAHARPALSTPYVAPRTTIEATVVAVMEDLLGIESIGIHDNFFELGGHSLLAIQAITRLRQAYQVDLPMRAFLFEAPTAAGLAKTIAEHQPTLSDQTQSVLENLLDKIEIIPLDDSEQKS